jgi:hypothetical protein
MGTTDIKIYSLNSIALLLSMSELESSLKIILLICTIVYTVRKTKGL